MSHSGRVELTWVSVQCGHNRSLVIGCVYRPPAYCDCIEQGLDALELSVQTFLSEVKQVALCGDLNCDLLRPSLPHVRHLLILIRNTATGLHQCVQQPTRIASSSSTLIDIALNPRPHMLFSHPRTHMGGATPHAISALIEIELWWDENQTNPWDVVSPMIPEFTSLGHILTPPGRVKEKKMAI